jgi:ADP-heptose:LPS heptosyltransferase
LKILILKPSSLGDVIQALPVLRLLKLHRPGAEIFWWIDSALAPLLENDPDLADVVRFERKRWVNPRRWPEMLRSIRGVRGEKFDLVIDLQCLARSAVFAWLARGEQLVGLDEVREGARGFYDFAVPRKSFHTHAVDWYLSVLPRIGVPVHKNFTWLPARPARPLPPGFSANGPAAGDGLRCSPAPAGQTSAGRWNTLPNSCASLRATFRMRAWPSWATRKTNCSAKLFPQPRRNVA